MRLLCSVAFLLLGASASAQAQFNPTEALQIVDQGYVTGSFGDQSFTDRLVTVTLEFTAQEVAENAANCDINCGYTQLDSMFGESGYLTIAGIGTYQHGSDWWYGIGDGYITDSNGKASIPYVGGGQDGSCTPDLHSPCPPYFDTTGGELIVLSESGPYSETVTQTAATPEPSAFLLVGTGVVGVFGIARKRIKVWIS
jgi:hypothetical protein